VPAPELMAWVRLARGVLVPARAQGRVAVLPLDALPLLPEGTPPLMRSRAPSIYVLQVDPGRLLGDLRAATGNALGTEITSAEARRSRLRELVAAGQLRPLVRALRNSIADLEAGSAFTAVLAAIAAWRGYRIHDHDRLHMDPRHGNEGFSYC